MSKGSLRLVSRADQQIMYRWHYGGQTTREISRGLRLGNREAVERVIQRRVNGPWSADACRRQEGGVNEFETKPPLLPRHPDQDEHRELPRPWVVALYAIAFVLVCVAAGVVVAAGSWLIAAMEGK